MQVNRRSSAQMLLNVREVSSQYYIRVDGIVEGTPPQSRRIRSSAEVRPYACRESVGELINHNGLELYSLNCLSRQAVLSLCEKCK